MEIRTFIWGLAPESIRDRCLELILKPKGESILRATAEAHQSYDATIYVVYEEGYIVAWGMLNSFIPTYKWITDDWISMVVKYEGAYSWMMYVDPQFRGLRYGSSLLSKVCEDIGSNALYVFHHNKQNYKFYKKKAKIYNLHWADTLEKIK